MRRESRLKYILILVFAICRIGQMNAQSNEVNHIEVSPLNPTTNDLITITLYGMVELENSCAFLDYSGPALNGNEFTIDLFVNTTGGPTCFFLYSVENFTQEIYVAPADPGDYCVTVTGFPMTAAVTDDTRCFTVASPCSNLGLGVSTQPASCGLANGSATALGSGGQGPYEYRWSNGSAGSAVSGLSSGGHSVTATDNSGCITEASFTIAEEACSCRAQDSLALVAFYNATDGPNWLTGWNLQQPMDSWFGIMLNNDGCVRSIYLEENGLSGPLPDTIGSLGSLEALELQRNALSGPLPAALGSLGALQRLLLYDNNFDGSIPDSLGALGQLQMLELSDNQLSGSLPAGLGQLANLYYLSVMNNNLSGAIPPSLYGLSQLRVLNLSGNQFSGELSAQVGNLPQLNILALRDNQFSGPLPVSLGGLDNLSALDFRQNGFTGALPPEIGDMALLSILLLDHNDLTGDLPSSLATPSFHTLSLGNNDFTGALPALNTQGLVYLQVDSNRLREVPVLSLAPENGIILPVIYHPGEDPVQFFIDAPEVMIGESAYFLEGNGLTFEDILPILAQDGLAVRYTPQDSILNTNNAGTVVGANFGLNIGFDANISDNVYYWYKNGQLWNTITGSNVLAFPNIQLSDAGEYYVRVENPNAPGLSIHWERLVLNVSPGAPSCSRQADSLVLAGIYNVLTPDSVGGPWANPWNLQQPMDTWYGVTLNAQGCVEALGLPNNSMGHYIPIAIDQLSALKRLDLSGNNFTGCVGGSRDFWCNQLEMVDISGNVYLLYDNIEELCNPTWDFVCSPTSFDGFVGPDDLNAILNDPERFATTVSPPYHFYNCDGTNTITDDVAPGGCGPTVITRTYTLRDDNGQFRDACSQTITVSRPGFSHVVPPGPFTIGCGQAYPADGDGNPSPGFTGYPIVQTYFAEYNLAPSYDNLEASYTDDPPVLQGPGTLVIRRWTVTNSCAPGNPMAFTQNITICGNGSVLPPDMIFVEGGTYTMGCTPEQVGCEGDEAPHLVTLSDFYVGKFEVTQAEWEELMPDYVPTYGAGFGYDYPTYHISWYDAVVFCNRLSQQEGLTPCYYSDPAYTQVFDMLIGSTSVYVDVYWNAAAGGYRLPTEAEWEYAARGGALSQGYRYAGSNVLDAVAWYVGNNSPGGSKPVGQKAPNELGLYDMSGNVWEWCWDLYSTSYYADSPTCNPLGPDSSTGMVRRGGFWMGGANNCRLAFRIGSEPGNRNYTYGFRVVRGAPSSENCLNDECSTMAGLGVAPVCSQETYTNFSATASHIGPGNHPDCFYGSSTERDVWFAFSTSDTLIDVSVFLEGVEAGPNEAITNPQMALYRGDCDGGLAYLGFCTSSLDGDNQAQLDLAGLTPNTTYFIRINDYSLTADPNWGDFTLCITPYSPVSNCRMQDSLALVELYDATHENGDWVNEWDLSQPMDTWHGVVLNVDGCVDRLNLLFNNLAGELPDLNLPNLTGFSCRGNLLTGSIPDFSNLPNLLSLDCNGNEFTGGIPDFSNLPNLLYFSCSYNQLTGSIPDFANLPNLEDFFCNTAGQLDGGIPDFTNLPNLRRLWCPGNGLSGGIPDFTNLPSLETFSCSINQLSGFIPDFSNLPNLGLFNCFNNQLSGSIPDFSNTPNLSSLGCHFNQLSGQVPDFSDNCPNLQSFNFQNNLFTFEGILDGLMSPGSITYAPQDSIFTDTLIQRNVGESLTVGLGIDDTVTSNVYYWYKDGVLWNTIYGSNELSFSSLQADDAGVYHVQVQNPNAPELILLGRSITIQVGCLSNSTMLSPALCSGESLEVNGTVYDESNPVGVEVFTAASGCDSTVNISLNFSAAISNDIIATICQGESYLLDGVSYTQSGNYTAILTAASGCDSIVNLNLSVETVAMPVGPNSYAICAGGPLPALSVNVEAGETADWYDTPQGGSLLAQGAVSFTPPAPGTYYAEARNPASGCVSLQRLAIVVATAPPPISTVSRPTCNPFEVGRDTLFLQTPAGCDSLVAVDYFFEALDTTFLSGTTCQWEEVGVQSLVLASQEGCDSIVYLTLALEARLIRRFSTTTCEPDMLGADTIYLQTTDGCDSLIILERTLAPPVVQSSDTVICQGQSIIFNNQVLDTGGTYTDTLLTPAGCDSILQLNLSVEGPFETIREGLICEGGVYNYGDNAYTAPGQYQQYLQSSEGCDSLVTLILEAISPPPALARDDEAAFQSGRTLVNLDLTANDELPGIGEWELEILEAPRHGIFTIDSPGRGSYELFDPEFLGEDSLTYRLCTTVCPDTCSEATARLFFRKDCQEAIEANLPTGFTPDGDGVNDLFDPLGAVADGGCLQNPQNARLVIINRWGEVAFEADPYQPWDGRHQSTGSLAPQGVYFFILEFELSERQWMRRPVHVLLR